MDEKTTTILDFLLSGYLVFWSHKNFSLMFSSKKMNRKTNNPNVKIETSINLAPILGITGLCDEYMYIQKDADLDKDLLLTLTRLSSIETCYGYWFAAASYKPIQREINKAWRPQYYYHILTVLENNSKKLTSEANHKLDKIFYQLKIDKHRQKILKKEIHDYLNRSIDYFRREKRWFLAAEKSVVPMPNIFNDPISKEFFLNSFWESVCARSKEIIVENQQIYEHVFPRRVYSLLVGPDGKMKDINSELNKIEFEKDGKMNPLKTFVFT